MKQYYVEQGGKLLNVGETTVMFSDHSLENDSHCGVALMLFKKLLMQSKEALMLFKEALMLSVEALILSIEALMLSKEALMLSKRRRNN